MQSFLVKHQITQVTQTRYSPDVAPCDFWLFPKLKSALKGTIDEFFQASLAVTISETFIISGYLDQF